MGPCLMRCGMPEPLPKVEWTLNGVCPLCEKNVRLVLRLSQGQMPSGGAVRLEAGCKECGHLWQLPSSAGGARKGAARQT